MKPFEFNRLIVLFASLLVLFAFGTAFAQWQPDVRLTDESHTSETATTNNAWCVAAVADTVHVVWWDNRDGDPEIFYKRSLNNGSSWGDDTPLTSDSGSSYYPSVAASVSRVHVVWQDTRQGQARSGVFYKRSQDNGGSWSSDLRLSQPDTSADRPSVAVSGACVYAVWQDGRNYDNLEIYYRKSGDYGASWGGSSIRLTNAAGSSSYPSVSSAGDNVYVVW
jgi:hypothetical protein